MKIIGKLEHKFRNFKLFRKTGLKRLTEISKQLEIKRQRLEERDSFSYM